MAARPFKQIALLPDAYTPVLGDGQRHFVAYPVQSGPQACLIETTAVNRALEIVDALTIVPFQPSYKLESVEDPLYGRWLSLVADFYKADVAKLLKLWSFHPLANKTERQPPFLPAKHGQLVEHSQQLLNELTSTQIAQPAHVSSQTWLAFRDSLKLAKCWYTQHLKMGAARKACVEQWRILSMWESWEQPLRSKTTWSQRAADYAAKYPQRPTQAKLRGRTNTVSSSVAAFKKRCSHLGLIRGEVPRERLKRDILRRFVH